MTLQSLLDSAVWVTSTDKPVPKTFDFSKPVKGIPYISCQLDEASHEFHVHIHKDGTLEINEAE